jgi:hypothetical protein
MNKKQAHEIHGGLTQTTKMPCQSYSLPTIACVTGFKMRAIAGSICSDCYADKGNYRKYANNIEPAQHARLVSIDDPLWVDAMVVSIGTDAYFAGMIPVISNRLNILRKSQTWRAPRPIACIGYLRASTASCRHSPHSMLCRTI